MDSPSIRAAITEREAEVSRITSRTLSRKKDSVARQVGGLRKFVTESLGDIRELLAGKHANPALIRQELARHIDTITLLPEGEGTEVHYKGNWELLGYTDGAEGQS